MEDSIAIFAIIGVIISATGITSGFVYNARSIQQNTRTRYYQIQKDLQKEFHEIMVLKTDDNKTHTLRLANFAVFLVKLVNRKMMPKEYIFPHYDDVFSQALWIYNYAIIKSDREGLKEERKMVEEFCKENNIKEENPDDI